MRFIALPLATIVFTSCVSYEVVSPEIRGIVIDSATRDTLGGADVVLNSSRSFITDDDGLFFFPLKKGLSMILPASHRYVSAGLTIQKPGYHPVIISGYSEKLYSPIQMTKKTAEQGAAANP